MRLKRSGNLRLTTPYLPRPLAMSAQEYSHWQRVFSSSVGESATRQRLVLPQNKTIQHCLLSALSTMLCIHTEVCIMC